MQFVSLRRLRGALLVAATVLAPAAHADTVRVGGAGAALGTMRLLATEFEKVSPGDKLVVVPNLGSLGGLKALAAGMLDLTAVGRALKPEEAAQGLSAVEYGRTPFLLVTSKVGTSPVRTMAEVEAMYAGRVNTWPSGTPVRLVLRPLKDGDTEQLGKMSAQIAAILPKAVTQPGMIIAPTDQDTADAIEKTPGAIGTLTLALIITEGRDVRPVALNGVVPSVRSLADGSYPYGKTMYLARRDTIAPAAARFLEFLASPRGRQLIEDAGHVLPPSARDPR